MEIADREEWIRRLKEAKKTGLRLYQFQQKWNLSSGSSWQQFKLMINVRDMMHKRKRMELSK